MGWLLETSEKRMSLTNSKAGGMKEDFKKWSTEVDQVPRISLEKDMVGG